MIRIPGRIPIFIHPAFWVMAALIGFINSFSFIGTIIWMGIILVSVLFHELGHALTAFFFGLKPKIELVALGGLTYHHGEKLPFWKQFFIVLNGPLFGFLLFFFAYLAKHSSLFTGEMALSIITMIEMINLFWTIINLVPVLPLDGGQLLRIILEAIFGVNGFRYALMTSALISVAASLFFFLYQAFLIGALFFLLAFQSYDTWRKSRHIAEADRNEGIKEALEKAEAAFQNGQKEEAMNAFEQIRKKTKHGLVFNLATQYLAFLKYEKSDVKDALNLLLSIREDLASDGICLLHKLAFEEKNYVLVKELSGTCFQTFPSVETALRNAFAHAELKEAEATIGWLNTAIEEGLQNIEEILSNKAFDSLKQNPSFNEWLNSLKHSS